MLTEKLPIVANKYVCNLCDYYTDKTSSYRKHLTTAKHYRKQELTEKLPIVANEIATCVNCKKTYKSRVGLWKHNKKCNSAMQLTEQFNNLDQLPDDKQIQIKLLTDTVIDLVKQNNEFKELMIEQNKQMIELAKNSGHNTINNTTNNNKFNLNVFLNETCKDAITMDDFIKSFEVTREDFIRTGNVGFIEGISTVMLSRFRNMETHTRPLHCTDLKRETVYIKNADKWEKEDANKTQLRRAVKVVAHRNMNELWRWYNDNKPEVEQIGTDECENYFKYYKAALGGCGKEEDLKFEEKIIKNVLKEVQVDKNMLTISD